MRAAGAIGLVAVLTGCDPRAFDDLANQTWVDPSGKPGDLESDDYGVALGFGGSGPAGLRVVAASRTPAGVARLIYDDGGALESEAELVNDTVQVNPLGPRPAMAGDPSSYGMATGTVALGATNGTDGFALMIDVESPTLRLTPINLTIPGEPAGLALGRAEAGGAGTGPDLVAVAGTALAIKPDYQTPTTVATCTLDAAGFDVEIMDVTGDGVGEVLVVDRDGGVTAFDAATLVASDGMACTAAGPAIGTTPASGDSDSPGLVSGDFDGDGTPDLAIGLEVESRVSLFMNLTLPDPPVAVSLDAPAGAAGFGDVLAVGDFDSDGKDDLAVGAPRTAIDGTNCGAVYLYRGGAALALGATLHDASPESDQEFGRAITAASFGDATDVLVVGARDELFTYFRNPLGGDDVRR